jgi:hypothetical protein
VAQYTVVLVAADRARERRPRRSRVKAVRRGAIPERAAPPRGIGQGRWAPGAVGVVQVGPGRHDLVDPVEGCVVQDE